MTILFDSSCLFAAETMRSALSLLLLTPYMADINGAILLQELEAQRTNDDFQTKEAKLD